MSKYLYAKHPGLSYLAFKLNTQTNEIYLLSVDRVREEFNNGTNFSGVLHSRYSKEDLNFLEIEVFLLLLN